MTKRTSTISPLILVTAISAFALSGCGGAGWEPQSPDTAAAPSAPDSAVDTSSSTVARFRAEDPALEPFFENCHGYAVFPSVGKGGFWIGGAHGKGEVFASGRLVGTAALTQLTAGPQVGGQEYSEIIFFRDAASLRDFTNGNFELGAQVSAVALDGGNARHAAYDEGVAVFTLAKRGLMAEATVAGQKFDFSPADG